MQVDKVRHEGWGEANLGQYSQYMGQTARQHDSWPAIALKAWRPEHNKTAMLLRGLTRCDQPQYLEAEEQLQDFATYAALRGLPNADWRSIAHYRAEWCQMPQMVMMSMTCGAARCDADAWVNTAQQWFEKRSDRCRVHPSVRG